MKKILEADRKLFEMKMSAAAEATRKQVEEMVEREFAGTFMYEFPDSGFICALYTAYRDLVLLGCSS